MPRSGASPEQRELTAAPGGRRLDRTALVVVVLVGLLNLPLPFSGDTALFAFGAEAMRHGAVLYRDFWDFKQPGIYLFNLAAGSVFGFSEVAAHLAELLLMVAFAAFIAVELRSHVRRRWAADIAPLVVVGSYYAGALPYHLGQVEGLVGPLLFVAMIAAQRAEDRPSRRREALVALGLAAGAVVLLKHFYVLLPAVWLLRTVIRRVRGGARLGPELAATGWAAAGFAAVTVPVAAYLAAHDQLGRVWWTWFEYAPQTTSVEPPPLARLIRSVAVTGAIWAVLFALAALALSRRSRWRERFFGDLILWLVVAVPLFLVQSWWLYHLLVFLPPVALLAVLGLEDWMDRSASWRPAARWAPLAVLALPMLIQVGLKIAVLPPNDLALTTSGRRALREQVDPTYADAAEEVRFLRDPDALGGGIYVVGSPIYQRASGRDQAIPMEGWSPELHTPEAWREITADLVYRSPAYVFIDAGSQEPVERLGQDFLAALDDAYVVERESDNGTWYRRR